jgi:hypothetical protein
VENESEGKAMNRKLVLVTLGFVCFALLTFCRSTAWGQQSESPKRETDGQDERKAAEWLHGVYLNEMSEYEFYFAANRRKKLVMGREPALRYPSPPEKSWGEVYLWTDRGRPVVVGCVFGGPGEKTTHRIFHEFHSLTPEPLVEVGGATGWQPTEAGIKFEPAPDAPEPDKDKTVRLAQMRGIAWSFKPSMHWKAKDIELRFLPQPIYRYEVPTAVVDGAVFTYVHNEIDDPEVLLIVEAQRTGNAVRWHYALARLTDRETWINYKGKEVWRVGARLPGMFDRETSKRYGVYIVKNISHAVEATSLPPVERQVGSAPAASAR